jgi:hypothetical protein
MLIRSGLLAPAAVPLGRDAAAKTLEMRTSNYQDTKLHGRGSRRCRSVDWSCLVGGGGIMMSSNSSSNNNTTTADNPLHHDPQLHGNGPVLKDLICLEQIVSMDPKSKNINFQ